MDSASETLLDTWPLFSVEPTPGKHHSLPRGKAYSTAGFAVHVFFSCECALFLFVPEPIFMDNLLKEEIWFR